MPQLKLVASRPCQKVPPGELQVRELFRLLDNGGEGLAAMLGQLQVRLDLLRSERESAREDFAKADEVLERLAAVEQREQAVAAREAKLAADEAELAERRQQFRALVTCASGALTGK